MHNSQTRSKRTRSSGHAVIEFALLAPWIIFLFIGVFDFGFFAYALISVENATRAAALYTSSGAGAAPDSTGACQIALEELQNSANVGSGMSCSTTCAAGAFCQTTPTPVVSVRAQSVTLFGTPASEVTVTYQTVPVIPIPGLLSGPSAITRVVSVRVSP